MRICPHCSSDVPAGPRCSACGAVLQGETRVPWVRSFLLGLGIVMMVLVVLALLVPALLSSSRMSNDRSACSALKTLATAEADFRANDRDGNKVQDFWTGDVAGLYCITGDGFGSGVKEPIKLIELAVAGADGAPLGAPAPPYDRHVLSFCRSSPKSGYWYTTLRSDLSETPPVAYRQDSIGTPSAGRYYHPYAFGFLSYPDTPSSGKVAFIINESNIVYRRPCNPSIRPSGNQPPGPVTHPDFIDWPAPAALKSGWVHMD